MALRVAAFSARGKRTRQVYTQELAYKQVRLAKAAGKVFRVWPRPDYLPDVLIRPK